MRIKSTPLTALLFICASFAALVPNARKAGAQEEPRPDGEPTANAIQPLATLSTKTHIFYYPWYGSPAVNGSYRHWNQAGLVPPDSIASNFYPVLGAYDSGSTSVIDQHMAWIQRAGVGTIVLSWWGQGSYEDKHAQAVLNSAASHGIKVAWHIEPYSGRTAGSTVSDIEYIISKYGNSSAFYRDPAHGNRGAFYVFDSLAISDWSALEQVRSSAIVLQQSGDVGKATHFGGIYTYDVLASVNPGGWKGIADWCRANGVVWAPSVGPGFVNTRAAGNDSTPKLDRSNGATYDKEWQNALDPANGGKPDWVSVTSFNEWHEGTMIEPATPNPPSGYGYATFENAYGKTGAAAETSYLDRTAYWIGQF